MLQLLPLVVLASGAPLQHLGPVATGSVRVVLIRHGQALSNLDPTPDLPPDKLDHLTDLGREQSRRAAEALRAATIARIYSSPASRAQETAGEIAKLLGERAPSVTVDRRLRSLDLGRKASGEPLDWDARIADWEAGRDPVPSAGESLEQVGQRVLDLVLSSRKAHAGRTIVLVAHSEVIGSFLGQLGGVPGPKRYPPKIANGSLTVVEAGPQGKPRVLLENWVAAP